MYWPSTPSNGEYIFMEFEEGCVWLNPDEYLARYPNWRDFSQLPTSSKESTVINREMKRQADPLEKTGVVGAFCRSFDVAEAIEQFLPDVYEPSAIEGRYNYAPADSTAGVVVYEDKWVYSHHASDPANGQLLNVFDLVRSHLYGDLDEKESNAAMTEFALSQEAVKAELLAERRERNLQVFDDWKEGLIYDKSGKLKNSLQNLVRILENDPEIQGLRTNDLAGNIEVTEELPWKRKEGNIFWDDEDDNFLIRYVTAKFGAFSQIHYKIAVNTTAGDKRYHPVREFLDSLPPWDGVSRLETLLIDYFGAEDNTYTRKVTKMTLCAAVVRIKKPGVKFDTMMILEGGQGIGKSTFLRKLGNVWFSDSMTLSDLKDKTGMEKIQGQWIMEISELAGMNHSEIDKLKGFLSSANDNFRGAYDRRATPRPRQCIFIGTVNPESGYLRDTTGNRRFLPVPLERIPATKSPFEITDDEVLQIWAEVVELAEHEKLYLPIELDSIAKKYQRQAMASDDREEMVREFLDMLLPKDWDYMDISERREFHANYDPLNPKGTERRETVSNREVFVECFKKRLSQYENRDGFAIARIIARIGGWERTDTIKRHKEYGRQKQYKRSQTII
jgi:predicted P-loop ATPase